MFVCRCVSDNSVAVKACHLYYHVCHAYTEAIKSQDKAGQHTIAGLNRLFVSYFCHSFIGLYFLNSKGKCRGLKGTLGILKLGTCQYKDPCSHHVIATILYIFLFF